MLRGLKMMCPLWMLLAVSVWSAPPPAREKSNECWQSLRCNDSQMSDENREECEALCTRSALTGEMAQPPGEAHLLQLPPGEADLLPPPEPEETSEDQESNALPTLPLSSAPPAAPQDTLVLQSARPRQEKKRFGGPQDQKRTSYAIQHFRWSKPVGRKRRPIKVFTNDVEEESSEALPAEMRREAGLGEAEKQEQETLAGAGLLQQKKDVDAVPYAIKQLRWSAPPASKQYGSSRKSWDQRSQEAQLTPFKNGDQRSQKALFKSVINKDGQQKEEQ